MRQFVALERDYRSFIFLADYHALNFIHSEREMRDNTLDMAIDYLAIGLDPEVTTLFKQSDVPEHTELSWILGTLTTMPYLMRAHAYKNAEAKGEELSVGTFIYPMLMAADILLYDTDIVPVGRDQKQHVEITRDTAEKFNRTYGPTFKLPKELILEDVAVVPGTDGRKMSKSYGNTIPLFAEKEEIADIVMSIVTDSSGKRPENVYAIHKLLKTENELEPLYRENEGNYKALKEALIEDIDSYISSMREKRKEYKENIGEVKNILKSGGEKARAVASIKIKEVRKKIGITL